MVQICFQNAKFYNWMPGIGPQLVVLAKYLSGGHLFEGVCTSGDVIHVLAGRFGLGHESSWSFLL